MDVAGAQRQPLLCFRFLHSEAILRSLITHFKPHAILSQLFFLLALLRITGVQERWPLHACVFARSRSSGLAPAALSVLLWQRLVRAFAAPGWSLPDGEERYLLRTTLY